jgi:hypothetical protein
MKTILTIFAILLLYSCRNLNQTDKPNVIYNNNLEEGIIIYDKLTSDKKYDVIEIFDDTNPHLITKI